MLFLILKGCSLSGGGPRSGLSLVTAGYIYRRCLLCSEVSLSVGGLATRVIAHAVVDRWDEGNL